MACRCSCWIDWTPWTSPPSFICPGGTYLTVHMLYMLWGSALHRSSWQCLLLCDLAFLHARSQGSKYCQEDSCKAGPQSAWRRFRQQEWLVTGHPLYAWQLLDPAALGSPGLASCRACVQSYAASLVSGCSPQQGLCSVPKPVPCCPYRYKGVSKKKGRWEAKVMVNRKWAYRELFDSEEAAARAYDTAGKPKTLLFAAHVWRP